MKVYPETIPILSSQKCPKASSSSFNLVSNIEVSHTPFKNEDEYEELHTLWKRTIYISVLSFLVSFLLCAAGIVCSTIRSSASTSAFAADCLLDALTSIIVTWRYIEAVRGREAKERQACMYLGILFLMSALAVLAKAIADIAVPPEPEGNNDGLFWLSVSGAVAFALVGVSKYYLYRMLRNESILLDVVNTLFSGVFCVAIAITVLVIDETPELWYLDPIEGGIFALLMGAYGIKCIAQNRPGKPSIDGYQVIV